MFDRATEMFDRATEMFDRATEMFDRRPRCSTGDRAEQTRTRCGRWEPWGGRG